MVTPTKIDQVRLYRRQSAILRGATSNWQKMYGDRKRYDKQGFGFTLRTDTGWNAFQVPPMAFEAYVGTYGSSSCGNAWSVDQSIIGTMLPKALNVHKQAIFDTIADMLDKEAAALVKDAEAELEAITRLLEEARQPALVAESADAEQPK